MVAREATGAGGYLHWLKYRERKEKMPIAIVVGARAHRDVHRAAKTRDRRGRDGGGRRRGRRGDPHDALPHHRPRCAGGFRDRGRGPDRLRCAGARSAVRREQRLCRARGLQHADRGDGDHPQEEAGVRPDHQPGDAERVERHQEGGLRAAVPRAPQDAARRQGHPPRGDARAADQSAAGDLPAVRRQHAAHRSLARAAMAPPRCNRTAARSSSR